MQLNLFAFLLVGSFYVGAMFWRVEAVIKAIISPLQASYACPRWVHRPVTHMSLWWCSVWNNIGYQFTNVQITKVLGTVVLLNFTFVKRIDGKNVFLFLGYPQENAAKVALTTVRKFLEENSGSVSKTMLLM